MPTLIPVTPKRKLDFTGLAVGATQDLVLAERVDIRDAFDATLLVRVHDHSLASGAGSIQIFALAEGHTREDPGMQFVSTLPSGAPVLINSSTPSPAYKTSFVQTLGSGNVGPMARIIARANRTTTGALDATLSVGLHALAESGDVRLPEVSSGTLKFRVRGDLGVTTEAGKMTGWADQSGNALDLATGLSSAPAYDGQYLNGRAAPNFGLNTAMGPVAGHDGADWIFAQDGTGVTLFCVANSSQGNPAGTTNAGAAGFILSLGTAWVAYNVLNATPATVININSNAVSTAAHLITARYRTADTPNAILRLDGTQVASGNELAAPSSGNAQSGLYISPGASLIGKVGEVIAYQGSLSLADIQSIESYLRQAWRI